MHPIAVERLTKRYGDAVAVDDLTFAVAAGPVTGFLGPNGAGKTTTLRMLLGLATDRGRALVLGAPYRTCPTRRRSVPLIDASAFHPGRRARHELAIRAAAAASTTSGSEVLAEVGLEAAGRKRVGQLSLGMRQRLGLAAALLGEPRSLVLDEPANGLDPAGMHWLRQLLRGLAERRHGRARVEPRARRAGPVADDVVVIDHGRLVTQSPVDQ